jgi:hypothetical protein
MAIKNGADPLVCSESSGYMKIISFIEDDEIIEKILRHINPWENRNRDPPSRKDLDISELI